MVGLPDLGLRVSQVCELSANKIQLTVDPIDCALVEPQSFDQHLDTRVTKGRPLNCEAQFANFCHQLL